MYKKLLFSTLCILLFQFSKAQNEFITVWQPGFISSTPISVSAPYPAVNNQVWFPAIGNNFTISWEEVGYPSHHGTMTNITSAKQVLIDFGTSLHPNPMQASYRVKVSNVNGPFRILSNEYAPSTGVKYTGSVDKLLEIAQWGDIQWSTMNNAFAFCPDITLTASDVPDLSNVTDLSGMFRSAKNFTSNHSINSWDTSSVQDMSELFSQTKFNSPIDNWNTSNVTNMFRMFHYTKLFNQPLKTWDVSKVTNMQYMFMNAEKFNQPLQDWNTESLTTMADMFNSAREFNQSLNTWNISNVASLSGVFSFAVQFNQPLNNWDTSKVTDMSRTFLGATNFNQNINSWDTTKVGNMSYMFAEAVSYNEPMTSWKTGSVTDMSFMFHFDPYFNQNISNWNTAKVVNMEHMLHRCYEFSHNLENWDVSTVSNMDLMLKETTSYNHSLEKWNLNSLTTAFSMLTSSGLDCVNYSNTLMGWSNNSNTPDNINLGDVSALVYSGTATPSRNLLLNTKGWVFMGDSLGSCELQLGVSDHNLSNEPQIYPNPATDMIYLKNIPNPESYIITDMSGRLIIKESLKSDKISASLLSPGNYILQIFTKNRVHSFPFIKK
ncbi:BspA family leucine-rich repeat surface protein [Chryseobacterium sp. HR92]|uniref:BspA family leucine-rich repeat surface protein n=1 Tax=Chryseobacterium sp. HR92 TaxID=3094839 RepID=UPI00388D3EFF|nr:BspA family leucine-rich repeat surface protein [Chryseobacterium sp. HR92]